MIIFDGNGFSVGRLTDDCFKNLMDQIYANLQNLKELDLKFGK